MRYHYILRRKVDVNVYKIIPSNVTAAVQISMFYRKNLDNVDALDLICLNVFVPRETVARCRRLSE